MKKTKSIVESCKWDCLGNKSSAWAGIYYIETWEEMKYEVFVATEVKSVVEVTNAM